MWALNYLVLQPSELLQNAANPHEGRTPQTDLQGLLTFVGPDQMLDRERLAFGWALVGIHILCPCLDLLQDNAGDLLAGPKLARPCSFMHRGCQRGRFHDLCGSTTRICPEFHCQTAQGHRWLLAEGCITLIRLLWREDGGLDGRE